MAEIEHFVDPEDKSHAKFDKVKDYEMVFFSACNQMDGKPAEKMSIGSAVASGLVANETLGYYLARVHQYMVKVGVNPKKLRFRQHMSNEMAHYACDCWDAECLTSYGWIECVGNADRSCYDLTQHYKATGLVDMCEAEGIESVNRLKLFMSAVGYAPLDIILAEKKCDPPREVDVVECVPNKPVIGKEYRREGRPLIAYLEGLSPEQCASLENDLTKNGEKEVEVEGKLFKLTPQLLTVKRYKKTIHVQEIVPSVIEPSFGIGRVMYAVFEHNFKTRKGDEARSFVAFPPVIAPLKCSVLPLSGAKQFDPIVEKICDSLRLNDVSHKVDDSSGSIGKRYARTDEIGIPFGITVDFDSLKTPCTATLRERDTMGQVRAPLEELASTVRKLVEEKETWADIERKYPKFEQQESSKE